MLFVRLPSRSPHFSCQLSFLPVIVDWKKRKSILLPLGVLEMSRRRVVIDRENAQGEKSSEWKSCGLFAHWHSWTLLRFWRLILWNLLPGEFISIPKESLGW